MRRFRKMIFSGIFLFFSFNAFAQILIINTTYFNTDKGLLKILAKKEAHNIAILTGQTTIYEGLKDIKDSKVETRIKEFEKNKYDRSLKVPLALNLTINNLLLGGTVIVPAAFYNTAAKKEYFLRELAINNSIALQIGLTRNGNIRNVNTQELYALDQKMLSKLKKTNKNAHKNAAFVLLASLLAKTTSLSISQLNDVVSLDL